MTEELSRAENLSVWTNGCAWVIASDPDEANDEWMDHEGECLDTSTWRKCRSKQLLTIFCDHAGSPAMPDEDNGEYVTKTCLEWVLSRPRGVLAWVVE